MRKHLQIIHHLGLVESYCAGSSQSFRRVQPKNVGRLLFVAACLTFACQSDPYSDFEGTWSIDIEQTQVRLSESQHAKGQTKAASELSHTIHQRYRFTITKNQLIFGPPENLRTLRLEFRRFENKTRAVFRVKNSPHLLRITESKRGLALDFEGRTWLLKRDRND